MEIGSVFSLQMVNISKELIRVMRLVLRGDWCAAYKVIDGID